MMSNDVLTETGAMVPAQHLTKRDLDKVFFRLHFMALPVNYDMGQGIGFFHCMVPILERLYKDADEETKQKAIERHLTYFVSQVTAAGMILGLVGALEETSNEEEKEAVVAVKTGMMGPFAGIGDSLFKITIQAISGSIGAALALQGNFLGPIVMFTLYVGINTAIKYFGIHKGYEIGYKLFSSDSGNNLIQRLVGAAGVLGLVVIGSLIASSVRIMIGTTITTGETVIQIQDLVDSLMPNVLPLLFTVGIYFLMKKINRKYMVLIIFGILLIGTLASMCGILV